MRWIVVLCMCSLASAARLHERVKWTDAAIAEIKQTCGKKLWWCHAVGWEHGTAEPLPHDHPLIVADDPNGAHVLLGIGDGTFLPDHIVGRVGFARSPMSTTIPASTSSARST